MTAAAPPVRTLPPLARGPVLAAMGVLAVLLLVFADRYGYNRDELYFRMLHPAWGYVDQPPLTPLLARASTHLADSPWALRLPAVAAAVASVSVVVLITRELGGDRSAQALCAWGYALASAPLVFGHLFLTSSLDLLAWPAVALMIMRALLRGDGRWWWAAGLVVGLSTYNKLLVAALLLAIGAGVLLAGPRRALWRRDVAIGLLLAAAVGAPNVAYQLAHDLPQLRVGRALSEHNAADVRVSMWPMLLVLLGPPQCWVCWRGLRGLWQDATWRPVRGLAPGFGVLLVLVFAMGSQNYYTAGYLSVLFAAGSVPVAATLRGSRTARRGLTALLGVNLVVAGTIALPVLPLSAFGSSPVPDINQGARDTVGWPRYVAQVRAVVQGLPASASGHVAIVTGNYGEAGAVARFGRDLPPVFSGQNALYDRARPPASATVVVFVGEQERSAARLFVTGCRRAGTLDNGVGVDTEEEGQPIGVCGAPRGGWAAVWPRLHHLD